MIKLFVNKSKIHGKGLFTNVPIEKGRKITMIGNLTNGLNWVTPQCGLINHSEHSNVNCKKEGPKYFIHASREIMPGEEITLNYKTLPPVYNRNTNFN